MSACYLIAVDGSLARARARLLRRARARLSEHLLERALLPLVVSPSLAGLVGSPSRVYYRVYARGDQYAVLLVYEWPFQMVPPHLWDYEPVLVFLDRQGRVMEVYVDGYHYYIESAIFDPPISWTPVLQVKAPWRSMTVLPDKPEGTITIFPTPVDAWKTEIVPLTDRVLAELRARPINPLKINDKIIRDPWSIEQAAHWATYTEPTTKELLDDLAANYGLKALARGVGAMARELYKRVAELLARARRYTSFYRTSTVESKVVGA